MSENTKWQTGSAREGVATPVCGQPARPAARRGGAPEGSAWLPGFPTLLREPLRTPPRRITRCVRSGGSGEKAPVKDAKISNTSYGTSICGRRSGSIRKNIIGHGSGYGVSVRGQKFFTRSAFGGAGRPFALLDQPASEHGASVLFDPLVEQGANLLAEVGGVAQTREFVALERIAGSREKELPRGLCCGTGHVGLLKTRCMQGNTSVTNVHSTESALSVEICGKVSGVDLASVCHSRARQGCAARLMRACSACAGDYEDPDRTAWTPEESKEDQGALESNGDAEEFPAEE